MLNKIKNWFLNSETIFWARLQVFFGIIWGVIAVSDLSPIITSPKWFAVWGITNGVISEYLRRRNTRMISQTIKEPNAAIKTVTSLSSTPYPASEIIDSKVVKG